MKIGQVTIWVTVHSTQCLKLLKPVTYCESASSVKQKPCADNTDKFVNTYMYCHIT